MPHESENRLSLYAERSVSQCLEATFDFMRLMRSTWFRLSLWLFVPASLLFLFLAQLSSRLDYRDGWSPLKLMGGTTTEGGIALYFLLLSLPLVMVFALLEAYGEQGAAADRLTLRQWWPYLRRQVLRACTLAFCIAIFSSFFFGVASFFLLSFLLFAFLPSAFLLERQPFFTAVAQSVRLALRSVFSLAGVVFFVFLFGGLMLVALAFPFQLVSEGGSVFSSNAGGMSIFSESFDILYGAAVLLGFYMVFSMLHLALAFQYGSVSERVDDTSLESDIQHFEDL